MSLKNILVSTLSIVVLFQAPSFADDTPKIWIKNKAKYIIKSDVEATPSADITEIKTKISFGHTWNVTEDFPLSVSYYGDHIYYIDADPLDFPHTVKSRGLGLNTEILAPLIDDDRYYIGLDLFPQFNTADGIGLDASGFRIPSNAYVKLKQSDNLIIIGGLTVRPKFEYDFLPYVGLIYKPNDKLTFNIISDEQNASTISYKFTESSTVAVELDYDLYEYSVTKGNHDGRIIQNQSISMGLSLEHQLNDTFTVSIDGGGVFNRIIKFKKHPVKIVPDDGYYAGFGISANFY